MTTPVTTFLVLGASGDLASRLLLPALGQLLTEQPSRRLRLVGSGVEDWDDEHWRTVVASSFATTDSSGDAVEAMLAQTQYHQADLTDSDGLASVLDACDGVPAIYFALPPSITGKACSALEKIGVPEGTRLCMEKPFGTDADSAHELNTLLTRIVPEDHIHRIDHFLGNSTVFNLLGLRFANRLFEPVWNAEHIDAVDIVFDEDLGLENRARYYDHAGALIDMLQSHLLQVLSVFAMEPPATLGEQDLREAKGAVLRAARVAGDDPVASSRRARWTAGRIGERRLGAYVDEPGVDPARETETLAEVTVTVDNWRWSGVPFTLRSGKGLGRRRREIVITFKPASHIPAGLSGGEEPTRLHLVLGPDAMRLELNVNGPGDPHEITRATVQADFGDGELVAYGEVLEGILDGDPALSVRGDAAVECWRILAPVIDAWKRGDVPLDDYPAGSQGPQDWPALG